MKKYHTFFVKADMVKGTIIRAVGSMSGYIQFEDMDMAVNADYLKSSLVSYYKEYTGITAEVGFVHSVSYIGLAKKTTKITF